MLKRIHNGNDAELVRGPEEKNNVSLINLLPGHQYVMRLLSGPFII